MRVCPAAFPKLTSCYACAERGLSLQQGGTELLKARCPRGAGLEKDRASRKCWGRCLMQEAAARSLRRGLERLRPLAKNKTLRYGVPMMLLIIGGSFGLREFTQIRYDAQKRHSKMDPALEERIRKNKISLESEYEPLHIEWRFSENYPQ